MDKKPEQTTSLTWRIIKGIWRVIVTISDIALMYSLMEDAAKRRPNYRGRRRPK